MRRSALIALTAALWSSLALAEDEHGDLAPSPLHRPIALAPPPDAARLVVAQLSELARADAVDPDAVRDLWQPQGLSTAPSPAWVARVVEAIGPEGALGERLRTAEGVVAIVQGPDYARALIAG